VRIVDVDGYDLPERVAGRIKFRSPSATAGYYRNDEQTSHLIQDGWLDTGDIGYLADGELYINGRAKDLVIRAGRHFFPYELEEAVSRLRGVRQGCVAVCGLPDEASGTDQLIVMVGDARDRTRGARAHPGRNQRCHARAAWGATRADRTGTAPQHPEDVEWQDPSRRHAFAVCAQCRQSTAPTVLAPVGPAAG
jgi:acyl-CoA synthetase (AMP-forming)/AMP-acid ligase II